MIADDVASTAPTPDASFASAAPSELRSLVAYFLKFGAIGFGGSVALVGYMQRDLVERRAWLSDDDYKLGLALAQIMPGRSPSRRSASPTAARGGCKRRSTASPRR